MRKRKAVDGGNGGGRGGGGPGGIEAFLTSRYPGHRLLARSVSFLSKNGMTELSHLKDKLSSAVMKYCQLIFIIALADYFQDSGTCVALEVTSLMELNYTVSSVSLLRRNFIPQLPAKYSPMLEELGNPEEGPFYAEANVDVENDEVPEEGKDVEVENDEVPEEGKDKRGLTTIFEGTLAERGSEGQATACQDTTLQEVAQEGESLSLLLYDYTPTLSLVTCLWEKCSPPLLLRRQCYVEVASTVRQLWESGMRAVLMTGAPGTGMTGFLIYMLTILMGERKPILLRTKGGSCYFYEPPPRNQVGVGYRCYAIGDREVAILLLDNSVYFLVDGKLLNNPLRAGCTLLTATPLKTNYGEYVKDGRAATVVLPVWSAAEIALAWQEIFEPFVRQQASVATLGADSGVEDQAANPETSPGEGSAVADAGEGSGVADEQGTGAGADGTVNVEDADMLGNDAAGEAQAARLDWADTGVEEMQDDSLGTGEGTVATTVITRVALTLEIVKERYRKWGGSPRYVLEKPNEDLDTTVASVMGIQRTVEAIGKATADGEHPSHMIAHPKVSKDYQLYEYMFSSPYVTELALQKLKTETATSLRAFLTFKGLNAHGINGLKGYILEAETRNVAVGKQVWKVRQVYADLRRKGSEKNKVFYFGKVFHVPNLMTFPVEELPRNRIIWPASMTQGTFDAMKIVSRSGRDVLLELYQVTISSERNKHGLKYEAVTEIIKRLGIPAQQTRVYIATTSELYPKAGFQSWRLAGGRVVKDPAVLNQLAGISQFALDTGV